MVTNLLKCHAGEVEVIYLENVLIVFLLEGLEHPKAHVVLVGPPREVPITLDAQTCHLWANLRSQLQTCTHQVEEHCISKMLLDDCCKLRFSKSPGACHV